MGNETRSFRQGYKFDSSEHLTFYTLRHKGLNRHITDLFIWSGSVSDNNRDSLVITMSFVLLASPKALLSDDQTLAKLSSIFEDSLFFIQPQKLISASIDDSSFLFVLSKKSLLCCLPKKICFSSPPNFLLNAASAEKNRLFSEKASDETVSI